MLGFGPVLGFDGFGEAREFQVGVGVAGGIEQVFEPGAAGDAFGMQPVGFDFQDLLVEGLGGLGAEFS